MLPLLHLAKPHILQGCRQQHIFHSQRKWPRTEGGLGFDSTTKQHWSCCVSHQSKHQVSYWFTFRLDILSSLRALSHKASNLLFRLFVSVLRRHWPKQNVINGELEELRELRELREVYFIDAETTPLARILLLSLRQQHIHRQ
jgi:hypothetical protein